MKNNKQDVKKKEWTPPKHTIHGDVKNITMYNQKHMAADNPQGPGVPATHGPSAS